MTSLLTENFTHQDKYEWVSDISYTDELPIEPDPIRNEQLLLLDTQFHVEDEIMYRNVVLKILDEEGIRKYSNIHLSFDPQYEKLIIHHVNVIRDGNAIDQLPYIHSERMHNQSKREMQIYDHRLTSVLFLEDIRKGDIIDYAFSIEGFNPIGKPGFHHELNFQLFVPVNKIYYRILAHPSRKFIIKDHTDDHLSIAFNQNLTNPELTEWTWEITHTPAIKIEREVPQWFHYNNTIEIGDYQDWKTIIDKEIDLYLLADESHLSSEKLQADKLINEWRNASTEKIKQALLAIRFVQDEIRYLSLNTTINPHTPNHPFTTLKRRFGDCKDKTTLLRYFLKELDILSWPCLVNSYSGKNLPSVLPNFHAFDHVILSIEIDKQNYWIDPTSSLQGGLFGSLHLSDYGYGLPLKEGQDALIPLPKPISKVTHVQYIFEELPDSNKILFKVISSYFNQDANAMRYSLLYSTEKELADRYAEYYRKIYPELIALPIHIIDERNKNNLTITENYEIPHAPNNALCIKAEWLGGFVYREINKYRLFPLEQDYPKVTHEEVIMPSHYLSDIDIENSKFENEYFKYKKEVCLGEKQNKISMRLETLADHIPANSVSRSLKALDEIKQDIFINFSRSFQSPPYMRQSSEKLSFADRFNEWLLIIGILGFLSVLLRLVWFPPYRH